MPTVFKYRGYVIYFWSNESNEPVHIHISKGRQSKNSIKVWLTYGGGVLLSNNNNAKIPSKDLNYILDKVLSNWLMIADMWVDLFGTINFIS